MSALAKGVVPEWFVLLVPVRGSRVSVEEGGKARSRVDIHPQAELLLCPRYRHCFGQSGLPISPIPAADEPHPAPIEGADQFLGGWVVELARIYCRPKIEGQTPPRGNSRDSVRSRTRSMDCGHFGFSSGDSARVNGESRENPHVASTAMQIHFPVRKGRSFIFKTFPFKSMGTAFRCPE